MKRTKGKGQESLGSSLLSPQENERLEDLLGRRCVVSSGALSTGTGPESLSSAVVQLLMALPSEPTRWTLQQSGVVCFVKDSPQRSYFIRLYDIKAGKLVWEQEIYNQLMYQRVKPFFHTFPGDDCQVGLNFADLTEADIFFAVVEEKISQRNNRFEKQQRKGSVSRDPGALPPLPPPNGSITPTMPPSVPITVQNQIIPTKSKKEKKQKEKKNKKKGSKLLKGDIGAPSGFTHVGHLGMNSNNLDPDLMKLLSCAGISEADLKDSETSQIIYDVIERSGGMEAVKMAMNQQVPGGHRGSLPQVPTGLSSAPPPPPGRTGPLPPAPGPIQSSGPPSTRGSLPPTPPRGHSGSLPAVLSPQAPEVRSGPLPPRSVSLGPLPPVPQGRNGPLPQPPVARSGPLPPPPGGRSGPLPPPPGERKESLTPVQGRRTVTTANERQGSVLPPQPAAKSSPPLPPGARSGRLPPPPRDNSGCLPPPPLSEMPLPPPPSDFFPPPPEDLADSVPPPLSSESRFPPRSNHQHSSGFTPPPPPFSAKPSTGGPPPPPPPPPAAPPPMNFGSTPSPLSGKPGPPPPASSGGVGGRDALLTQIQSGMKLKKVTSSPEPPSPVQETEGIVGALMMAMQKRSKVIHSSEEEDEFDDDDDDDEEWD
ncbi:actin nucleation-promoting factor WAS-like isoform X2 [Myxocyprinus asiaticus]|uniref:actin nucleation-promoting factor WAS-like isoform X2 n=1 Tax=Myxocyprinus asiaticus TaxID=70543 RepID=UPI00222176B1|nr:actin nucleation-promoting factor WAS-like isoform X2 [Myxocyprinus asiaticus]